MVLTSTDSSEYFENKPNCFRVHLSKQIQFDGYWTVALTEFSTESWTTSNKTKSELFVCCDICEENNYWWKRGTPPTTHIPWRET